MQEEQKVESVFLSNEKKRNVFKAETMRLTNPKDFKKCFQAGKRTNNKVFSLYYIENGGLPGRLGVNVAKSKIKKAVNRNKIKRAAREVFRKGGFNGLDIVLLLKNEKNYNEAECFMLVHDVFSNIIKK
tara:strand:+ start:125 stop:511 length:387 start_codon:yes stop_codon:yes gene_type:complete